MAELATIARPYAEALFKSVADSATAGQLDALAAVASDAQVRQFADSPKASAEQVAALITAVALPADAPALPDKLSNLLRTVIDNGRVQALPEIAAQYRALVNAQGGVADATIYSAFGLGAAQLADVLPALERRFGRKLNPTVVEDAGLIGGIRVVVGDEVLDTSVKARLAHMKAALTA